MPKAVAMILAGGHVDSFGILTRYRPKAALPFAGFYRLIDFALSNLSHSQITHAGLIIQYQPASLIEHVGVGEYWDLHGVGRLLKILPPYVGPRSTEWFTGTADALYQNLNFIEDMNAEDVLILSGEHIYNMDYRPLIEFHRESGADVTLVAKDMPPDQCSRRFGYIRLGEKREIVEYYEKPDTPPTQTVSMGVYVFRRQALIEWLEHNASYGRGRNLAIDVIPFMVGSSRVMAYPFDGDWEYLGDTEAYFRAHQRLLDTSKPVCLVEWEVMTNMKDRGLSSRVSARVGAAAEVERSMLSPGVRIEGTVRGSVLSPGVVVERGAVVEDCILMHDILVRQGARLRGVVADKDVVFGENSRVGAVAAGGASRRRPSNGRAGALAAGVLPGPLTVLGKGAQVEAGSVIPAGKEISQDYRREGAADLPFPEGAVL